MYKFRMQKLYYFLFGIRNKTAKQFYFNPVIRLYQLRSMPPILCIYTSLIRPYGFNPFVSWAWQETNILVRQRQGHLLPHLPRVTLLTRVTWSRADYRMFLRSYDTMLWIFGNFLHWHCLLLQKARLLTSNQ